MSRLLLGIVGRILALLRVSIVCLRHEAGGTKMPFVENKTINSFITMGTLFLFVVLPLAGMSYYQNTIDEMEEAGLIDTRSSNEVLCHDRAEKIGYTLPEYKRHGGGYFSNPEIECWAVNKEGEPVQLW